MAQAIYTDDTQAAIARRLAATRAASAATVARAAPGYPSAAGINVTELPSQPTTITSGDIAANAQRLGASPANTIGSDIPAAARRTVTPGISSAPVDYASMSPTEQAAYSRAGFTPPSAPGPAVQPPPTAAPAAAPVSTPVAPGATLADVAQPSLASRVGGFFGSKALSLAEAPFTPAGLTIQAGLGAADSYNRPSSDYVNRFGAGVHADSLADDLAVRTAGFATDTAAKVADLGLAPVNYVRGKFGASPLQTFTSMLQANDNPAAAQRARVDASAQAGANMTAAPPSNESFANVSTGIGSTAPITGLAPNVVPLAQPKSDAGRTLPGRVVDGVRTFSDGSGDPRAPGYVQRTMTQQDIAALAHGNRISVADAGIGGGIDTAANGGKTLNLGDGPTSGGGGGFTAADRAQQYRDIETRGANADFSRLMGKSETELARGNKKTASILSGLAQQARAGASQVSDNTTLVDGAKAQEALANANKATVEAHGAATKNSLLNGLTTETDPTRRQSILDTLLASDGKNTDRNVVVKVPSGEKDALGNPIMVERVFDTRSRQYIDPQQNTPAIAR